MTNILDIDGNIIGTIDEGNMAEDQIQARLKWFAGEVVPEAEEIIYEPLGETTTLEEVILEEGPPVEG